MHTLLYLSRNSCSQVSNRHPPHILIFRIFSTPNILISHPLFIKFQEIFQPKHIDSNKKWFQYFFLIFFVTNHPLLEFPLKINCIVVSNWVIINVTVICCIKTNNKAELKFLTLYDNIIFFLFLLLCTNYAWIEKLVEAK